MFVKFSSSPEYATQEEHHMIEVDTLEGAQRAYIAYRDENDLGVSRLSPARVEEEDGTYVAQISYNGRAWASYGEDDQALIAEAPSDRSAPEM